MQEVEALRPELKEYYVEDEDSWSGEYVKHPLVFAVPYHESMNGYLNKMFDQKVKELEKAIKTKSWNKLIWLHERPYRPMALMQFSSAMEPE